MIDADRAALERSRYLVATTDLTEREARALAYREMGYSSSGIAQKLERTPGTVTTYLDRIVAQYGLDAVETKLPEQRGNLSEVTPERLAELSDGVREQYMAIACRELERVPEEIAEKVQKR